MAGGEIVNSIGGRWSQGNYLFICLLNPKSIAHSQLESLFEGSTYCKWRLWFFADHLGTFTPCSSIALSCVCLVTQSSEMWRACSRSMKMETKMCVYRHYGGQRPDFRLSRTDSADCLPPAAAGLDWRWMRRMWMGGKIRFFLWLYRWLDISRAELSEVSKYASPTW